MNINSNLDEKDIYISIIGNDKHGKTTLVSAIAKVLAEKGYTQCTKAGNMGSINTLCVEYQISNINYHHMDCQGKDFQSVAGHLAYSNIAILVVDAIVGPMPQTREHILLSRQVGVPRMVVFMNKCDMVDDDKLLDSSAIRNLLNAYGFDGDNIPIIRGSALRALEGNPKYEQSILDLVNTINMVMSEDYHMGNFQKAKQNKKN